MSIHEYFQRNPAGPDLAAAMRQKQEVAREDGHPRSAVNAFARTIVDEGGAGLKQALRRFGESGLAISPTSEELRRIPFEERTKIIINNAAIVFGVTIVGIESALIDRRVDGEELCALYNRAISGIRFARWRVGEPQVLTEQDWRKMLEHANRDKTLASFFEEDGVDALPKNLRKLLIDSATISIIRRNILPAYRERAGFLIPVQG